MSRQGDYKSESRRRSSGSSYANGRQSRASSTFPRHYVEGEHHYRTDQSESRYKDPYGSTQHSSDVPRASIERSPSPSSAYQRHCTCGNDSQAVESKIHHENTPSSPGFQRDHRRSTRAEPRQDRPEAQTSHFKVYDDEGNEESRRRRSDAPPRESPPRALREIQDRNGPYEAENSSHRILSP